MELRKLTPKEFERISKLVYDRTGIYLPETKLGLLSNRLRKRLRALKLDSFDAYYKLLGDSARCEEELPHFLSAVTTNETYFFRNEALWKFVRDTWIPDVVERKKDRPGKSIRVWSAASSSGEEAYTMAICLRECVRDFPQWQIRVIGTDISKRVLDKARAGQFDDYAVSRMPKSSLKRWFNAKDNVFVIKEELRKFVTFQSHNLRDPLPNARFDLVFLRNVLMYFDVAMKLRVLANVSSALIPGGHLVVGDVDPIRNTTELNEALTLDYCGPNLYRQPRHSKVVAQSTSGS